MWQQISWILHLCSLLFYFTICLRLGSPKQAQGQECKCKWTMWEMLSGRPLKGVQEVTWKGRKLFQGIAVSSFLLWATRCQPSGSLQVTAWDTLPSFALESKQAGRATFHLPLVLAEAPLGDPLTPQHVRSPPWIGGINSCNRGKALYTKQNSPSMHKKD